MQEDLRFPNLHRPFPKDTATVVGRPIQISNLLVGHRMAYRQFYGREIGETEFLKFKDKYRIPLGEIASYDVFNLDREYQAVLPISRLFQGFPELNTFTKTFSEVKCAADIGYLPELLEKSCALEEFPETGPVIEQEDEFNDLFTILALENVRDKQRLNQKGLHLKIGQLTKEIIENQDEISYWYDMMERLKDMPEGFYRHIHPYLH